MAIVIVDGQEIEIDDDQRLNGIEAARKVGADVPHYCWHPGLSVVASCRMCLVETGRKNPETGERGFVLLRGLQPVSGISKMRRRRNKERERDLCSGPGKLSMALGITGEHHGNTLTEQLNRGFFESPESDRHEILADRRVGISRSQDLLWRFLAADNPHVSIPFGKVK